MWTSVSAREPGRSCRCPALSEPIRVCPDWRRVVMSASEPVAAAEPTQIGRRAFLTRSVVAGAGLIVGPALIAACSGTTASTAPSAAASTAASAAASAAPSAADGRRVRGTIVVAPHPRPPRCSDHAESGDDPQGLQAVRAQHDRRIQAAGAEHVLLLRPCGERILQGPQRRREAGSHRAQDRIRRAWSSRTRTRSRTSTR